SVSLFLKFVTLAFERAQMNVEAQRRTYADLHEHLDRLDRAGLLYRIDAAVNKDTEMHPLVRWQFRGGIEEKDRKAFLFNNIVDSKGRHYDIPVTIGAIATNPESYRIGMNVARIEDIGPAWDASYLTYSSRRSRCSINERARLPASTTGAITSISSRPKLPPSPACGLRPSDCNPRTREAGAPHTS